MGSLYIVATPIGNLKDITIRAIEVLQTVDGIACEDTRKTGFLLQKIESMYNKLVYYTLGIGESLDHKRSDRARPRLISYYEENELQRIPEVIIALKNGLNIALVSDAGTPTISDPGFKLVRECIKEGIRVESIPGPSSVISALVSSGLPTDKFLFLGYLPKKPGKRNDYLNELFQSLKTSKKIHPTIIIFEAPHRIVKTLQELKEVFGDINIVIARELTKLHEEIRRDHISESLSHLTHKVPKGEFVILFNMKV